ncbi:MAG: prepilin-type N-terminal cleavage/methylation domain-containing protein [Candidatus Omnitrophica bacterium]|nr:prepilin-type N-terminal cleavage/methylation domain-containing protein [Candidatus Omnitrophota bacterium]
MIERKMKAYCFLGNSSKGFSFLELMLVLFIISIFCVIVFPMFNNDTTSSALSQAQKMSDLIVYVNDKALMSKKENILIVDVGTKTISFRDSGRDKKMIFSKINKVGLLNGEVTTGEAVIAVSQWGIQQPVMIQFNDKNSGAKVDFNPVSAKAVVYEI